MNRSKVCLILLFVTAFGVLTGDGRPAMAGPGDVAHDTHIFDARGPLIQGEQHCQVCHLSQNGLQPDWYTVVKESCDGCHNVGGHYGWAGEPWTHWKNSYDDCLIDCGGDETCAEACAEANADASLIYDSEGNLLPGKEKWCASCHDDEPSSSKPTAIEVIVDNSDDGASFTGTWGTSDWAPGYYGPNYHYHLPGAGTDTFTWTPDITIPGDYTVYARWTADPSRAPDATYTIHHSGRRSPAVVTRDQRSQGGTWVSLGTYSFDSGDSVELIQSASGYVIADAIKWESGDPCTSAPNVSGDNLSYGFYVSGHGKNSANPTECLDCHDSSKPHIDGENRTYVAGGPTTYTDSYRLRDINGGPAMNIPRPLYPPTTNPLTNWGDFALCFGCHNRFEVLSQNPSVVGKTNFWNDDGSPKNSHNIHLGIGSNHFDSDWDGTADSSESCIACHNVHGSPNQVMIRHGELISCAGTADKVPALNFAYLVGAAPGTRDTSAPLGASIGGNMGYPSGMLSQNHVCAACHNAISYYRTPYLGPRVLNPQANPGTVDIGGGPQDVLLSATVTGDDLSGVNVDLSAIGGGVQPMEMDPEGGGLYTYLATVPDTAVPGDHCLVVTAEDTTANTGENTVILTVTKPGVVIVDNLDAGASFTGDWGTSSWSPGFWGTNYHYHLAGAGTDTFTWTPAIATPGIYAVYARWTEDPSRAPDATYTIYHDGVEVESPTSTEKDQRSDGGAWVLLGTFSFDGIDDYVTLVQSPNGYVIADAIMLELQ